MKKLIIYTLIVCSIFCFDVRAESINNDDVRNKVSVLLNDAVITIKSYFEETNAFFKQITSDLITMEAEVKHLILESQKAETNITLLKHGDSPMPEYEENKELKWDEATDTWVFKSPVYSSSCSPNSGEKVRTLANGDRECYQEGTFKHIELGYGVCQDNIGEKHSQTRCTFTNSKNNVSYEVLSTNAGCNKIQRYKKPCGPHGDKSDCKCTSGDYLYFAGMSYCYKEPTIKEKDFCNSYYPRTSSIWSWSWILNNYGISFHGNHVIETYTDKFYAPISGKYTVKMSVDNYGESYINGKEVARANSHSSKYLHDDTNGYTNVYSGSIYLNAGFHDLMTKAHNIDGPGGAGVVLYDPNNKLIKHSREFCRSFKCDVSKISCKYDITCPSGFTFNESVGKCLNTDIPVCKLN